MLLQHIPPAACTVKGIIFARNFVKVPHIFNLVENSRKKGFYVSMVTSGLGYHLNHNFYSSSGDGITLLAGNFAMPLTLLH